MTEDRNARLKRLRMRSWRRGIREMDLVLGNWADEHLEDLAEEDLAVYDRLLSENDHDLYAWITGRSEPPGDLAGLIRRISEARSAESDTH